jgi:hypothetical protein
MSHTLTLKVSEDLYEPLVEAARRAGQSPEELAARWLMNALRSNAEDPLEKFIGSVSGSAPDWADRHDAYLGQALAENSRDEKGA